MKTGVLPRWQSFIKLTQFKRKKTQQIKTPAENYARLSYEKQHSRLHNVGNGRLNYTPLTS